MWEGAAYRHAAPMHANYDTTRSLVDDRLASLRREADKNRLRRLARSARRQHDDDGTPTAA